MRYNAAGGGGISSPLCAFSNQKKQPKMKMKLPKALLLAVLASVLVSNANATITTGTGNPDRPDIIKTVNSGTLDIKDDYWKDY